MSEETKFYITERKINEYALSLRNDERADNTVEKYIRDVRAFADFCQTSRKQKPGANGIAVTKEIAIEWKIKLKDTHTMTSINSMLAALNGFCAYFTLDMKIKPYKIQKQTFLPEKKDLTQEEYERLLRAARLTKNERLFYVIQTLCALGLRVSELQFVTAEAVKQGQVTVTNKGKTRTVFVPNDLRAALTEYAKRLHIRTGSLFVTRNGAPLHRSNIWAQMKKLCAVANVDPSKVFPHNLRGLYSRVFYGKEKDLAKLADTLGHSSINTTRIYIMESSAKYRRIIENLGLAALKYT
ncbi:MAG: tyrosine-type recombinase/integrase [Oscillospiraceae bacterium]|nr:tyrosine-type recombinase/integrase [Oscillospiraceae bacterium]